MAGLNFKTLYTNGDSWTAGDIVDPELFGDNLSKVNDPDNKPYRLPRVWPHKIGKELNIEVINNSHAGGSNDRIFRSTVNDILGLLKNNKPEDLLVIIGWSSPERKDFFHRELTSEEGRWTTLQPSQNMEFYTRDAKDLKHFFDTYRKSFWQKEEFISRYVQQNLYLHY